MGRAATTPDATEPRARVGAVRGPTSRRSRDSRGSARAGTLELLPGRSLEVKARVEGVSTTKGRSFAATQERTARLTIPGMTERLRDEVQRSFEGPSHGIVERAILGTADADGVVATVSDACLLGLGVRLDDAFLYVASSGVVIGCALEDGRRLVLKAYGPRWTRRFLGPVKAVQSWLSERGYPCPRPLDHELEVGKALVLVEEELPDPGRCPRSATSLSTSSEGLAELVGLCRQRHEPDLRLHPLRAPHEGLYPEPHSPIFDFRATRDGAEWIDDIARRAKEVGGKDASDPLIAHTDWTLRNVRLGPNGPVAVYDWDSLALVRETEAVAIAAVSWCKTGGSNDETPDWDEIETFISTYEAARGHRMSLEQHRAARAFALSAMSYTARCEHAVDPDEAVWTTTRPRLRDASSLLG